MKQLIKEYWIVMVVCIISLVYLGIGINNVREQYIVDHKNEIQIWKYDARHGGNIQVDEWKEGYLVIDKLTGGVVENYGERFGHLWD